MSDIVILVICAASVIAFIALLFYGASRIGLIDIDWHVDWSVVAIGVGIFLGIPLVVSLLWLLVSLASNAVIQSIPLPYLLAGIAGILIIAFAISRSRKKQKGIRHLAGYRGSLDEPYCSKECYDKGGAYGSAVMLKMQSGVCGFCQSPVRASMYGEASCAAIPYEEKTLFVCSKCTDKAKEHLSAYDKCCICQKSL